MRVIRFQQLTKKSQRAHSKKKRVNWLDLWDMLTTYIFVALTTTGK